MPQLFSSLIMGGHSHIHLLYGMIVAPALLALLLMLIPAKKQVGRSVIFCAALTLNLAGAWGVFSSEEFAMLLPWGRFGIHMALRVYDFSAFIVLCIAVASVLVGVYSLVFLRNKIYAGSFFCFFLLTMALANGAALANNLVVLLFFWEGLLITLFVMIAMGNRNNVYAAVKALVVNGAGDLLLMLGIAVTAWQSGGTLMMDEIASLPIEGLNTVGFICMMLGALGKAGAVPFHTWIPDAAQDAPLPFMAFMPAILEKLLGIYLAVRVARDFYALEPGSSMSVLIMSIGAVTILLAVAMALIQKDLKRLLSYHAISQVGYMALGIGTALPAGMVGAVFHMLNHAIYKSCLFLCAGAVERSCGTTDLRRIGGLWRLMPLTTAAFILAALAISGMPPFNGFFSKELVFDAALESGLVFYVLALVGAALTAASFLKAGNAAFFGAIKFPRENDESPIPHEAPVTMLAPTLILALLCVFFGLWHALPISAIQGFMGDFMAGHNYTGWPSHTLEVISLGMLLLALFNHIYGVHKTGEGLKAVDHIHYAPGLRQIYDAAEKRYFDPYEWLMFLVKGYAWACFGIDRAIDWVYSVFLVKLTGWAATGLSFFNNGSSARYMAWAFAGLALVLLLFIVL